jgi:hypothetical protein
VWSGRGVRPSTCAYVFRAPDTRLRDSADGLLIASGNGSRCTARSRWSFPAEAGHRDMTVDVQGKHRFVDQPSGAGLRPASKSRSPWPARTRSSIATSSRVRSTKRSGTCASWPWTTAKTCDVRLEWSGSPSAATWLRAAADGSGRTVALSAHHHDVTLLDLLTPLSGEDVVH